jgi:hypothetical protein
MEACMNKKFYIVFVIILILGFYRYYNWATANREVLYIGKQVSAVRIDFPKQIKDNTQIDKVKELLSEVKISKNEQINDYADIVIRLDIPKKGINMVFARIWITSEGAKVKMSENSFGTLTPKQTGQLLEIANMDKN